MYMLAKSIINWEMFANFLGEKCRMLVNKFHLPNTKKKCAVNK